MQIYVLVSRFTYIYTSQVPGLHTDILLRYLVHLQIYFSGTRFIYIYTSQIPGSFKDILLRYLFYIHIYFSVTWFAYRYTSQVLGLHTDILLRYQVYIHLYFSGTWFTYRYTYFRPVIHTDILFRNMMYIQIYFWCMFLLGLYIAIYFTLQKMFVALVVSKVRPPPPWWTRSWMPVFCVCVLYILAFYLGTQLCNWHLKITGSPDINNNVLVYLYCMLQSKYAQLRSEIEGWFQGIEYLRTEMTESYFK